MSLFGAGYGGVTFSSSFKSFVSDCLNKDPVQRPSACDLLRHRFVKNVKSSGVLSGLIAARGGVESHCTDDSVAAAAVASTDADAVITTRWCVYCWWCCNAVLLVQAQGGSAGFDWNFTVKVQ